MATDPWVEELRLQLDAVGNEERARGAKAYLKSDLEVSGLTLREGSKFLPEAQCDNLRRRFRDC